MTFLTILSRKLNNQQERRFYNADAPVVYVGWMRLQTIFFPVLSEGWVRKSSGLLWMITVLPIASSRQNRSLNTFRQALLCAPSSGGRSSHMIGMVGLKRIQMASSIQKACTATICPFMDMKSKELGLCHRHPENLRFHTIWDKLHSAPDQREFRFARNSSNSSWPLATPHKITSYSD